ncbi:2OG-Fe(II) oxygenase [Flagellimonas halotolerans]|uniref:2OG-Fe(II) oxygenase n=1 Tax=Flagellimonas halotolerans TaxID=3112164 RepID=A0ABU6IS54_9FLAO|nr:MULTISPECIES: 2OG-Fe(II) oxygenase [unclassified Allomuricauda]MEC3965804.1 2OG-Fe(II) oxygenase [Muricauda sp. SYSU M86414]MEC4265730.1 2OG-Fe(II) oxygenase [Muricauda sp. SYSU M84420]
MNQLKKNILICLQDIKGSGKFASIRTADFIFPGLEVETVGEVAYPINQFQAKALIQVAHKAPFGKGSQTIVDNNVRSAWEIDADKLHFNNPNWNGFLGKAIKNIKTDLGLEDYTVTAHLYKLLIYEEGDFFLSHKDSEKEKGMFGSLVIGLPSQYTGGELVIRFDGNEVTADFANANPGHTLNYAAFYADCDHEVKLLTSGHRVCLVYNLVQQKAGKKIEPQSLQSYAGRLAGLFVENNTPNNPYIILLGHQYTPKNFSEDALKLNDRAKTEALLLAAKQAGYYAKLCLVTSYLAGTPEYDGYYDDEENTEMGEVYEEYLSIEHWLENELPAFDEINFEEDELLTSFPLNEGEPLIKESTGYMGNYGPDIMHWYHYGAVMIWSPEMNAELLYAQNAATQLNWITFFNRAQKISDAEVASVKDMLTEGLKGRSRSDEKENFNAVADWLVNRNEKVFLTKLDQERLQFFFEKIDSDHWVKLFQFLPVENTTIVFEKIVGDITFPVLEKLLGVLNTMIDTGTLKSITLQQIALLPDHFKKLYANTKRGISAAALSDLFQLAQIPTEKEWVKTIVEALTKNTQWEYIHNMLVPKLLTAESSEFTEKLLSFCREYLQQRIDNKPQPPADWSRPIPDTTGYSAQWKILKTFLESPDETVFDFRKNQSERSKMELAIKNVVIDLKTETIKKGSPHILRITKTQDAYNRLMKSWHKDAALLENMK